MISSASRHQTTRAEQLVDERLGAPFILLLVWLFFEFGRPTHPFGIPLLISLALFFTWITGREKQWSRQSPWWLALLAVMVLGTTVAPNTYAAFWTTKNMAVLFLCICLPLQAQVTSTRKVRLWAYTFLAVSTYVGGWAALHAGYGPAGARGSQDENYVAALMGMAMPFAYFSLFIEKRLVVRILLVVSMVIFVAAIALGENPSRGGFLGLCAVAAYCISRSPRKLLAFGLLLVIGLAFLVIAGPSFWKEIRTSTDYQTGTGDLRLEFWKAGMRMWEANPVLGVGAGNFRWVIGDYQSAEQMTKLGHNLSGSVVAHSLPVEVLAELGCAGAICTAVLVWLTWVDLGRIRHDLAQRDPSAMSRDELTQLSCYADAIRGAILAILVNGVFLSLTYFSHLWLLLAFGSALPFVYSRLRGNDTSKSTAPVRVRGGATRRESVEFQRPTGGASAPRFRRSR
jgi:O-antigen ligase